MVEVLTAVPLETPFPKEVQIYEFIWVARDKCPEF